MKLDDIDKEIIAVLSDDARISYADLGRRIGITRAKARERVIDLVKSGIIEKFTIFTNFKVFDGEISAFFNITVAPAEIENISKHLETLDVVTALYIMSNVSVLHLHAHFSTTDEMSIFAHEHLYSYKGIINVESGIILKRVKQVNGGVRV